MYLELPNLPTERHMKWEVEYDLWLGMKSFRGDVVLICHSLSRVLVVLRAAMHFY